MSMQGTRWQSDADVVVAGYGAAGAVAAITAHDAGAQVVILEKQEQEKLVTTSFMAGGGIVCVSDAQAAARHLEALYRVSGDLYWTEPEVIRAWAKYAAGNKGWVESMGGHMQLYRHGAEHKLPGSESIDNYHIRGLGPGLMRILYNQVNTRNIPVMYNTAATELLTNSRGEVVGVRAKRGDDGQSLNVQARRAVILTTGGFEFNEQMKLQYLRIYPTYFTGSPANTGDGITMAQAVGAELWHMNCCSARFAMKFPEVPSAMDIAFGGMYWRSPAGGAPGEMALHTKREAAVTGFIVVDRYGKRYTDENFKMHALYYELAWYDSRKLTYPRVPSYWVFDRKRMDDGPLATREKGATGPSRFYRWSNDNSEELERGWIKRGDTVKELAAKLGMEPQTLATTVDNYNLYCEHGDDRDYGRDPNTLFPLATPPYYAVELWPGGPNTQGGPRRNASAQVLRPGGQPIPGLYSAGELGSIYGMLYPSGGGNLCECIAFGRIAGENAAAEKPR